MVLKRIDGKWEYDLKELIKYVEEESKKFVGKADLQKAMGVYRDFLNNVEKRHGIKFNYNFNIDNKRSVYYKAIYQDYDWCYQKYVIERKTYQEMADELGVSKRVIQKWCSEKHRLNNNTLKNELHLNNTQRELILASMLGDGHIDKRETQPMFIVSHADNQKDYLYWKYSILENLCNKEPSVVQGKAKDFKGEIYECRKQYRINTKIIYDLKEIRAMTKLDIIRQLNEFQLSIFILDDGHRGNSNWMVCVADFSKEEKDEFINICRNKLNLSCRYQKDDRYLLFDSISTNKLDEIILDNIPNNLDIIKYKLLENEKLKNHVIYLKVILENGSEVGISKYFKINKKLKCSDYIKYREELIKEEIYIIKEEDLLNRIRRGLNE